MTAKLVKNTKEISLLIVHTKIFPVFTNEWDSQRTVQCPVVE